jgi:hypothetical protein
LDTQTVALLDTHPALLLTILDGFNLAKDWTEGEAEMRRLIDSYDGSLFVIADMRLMKISFDDLILGASLGGRGSAPIWHHPKVQGVYFISDSKLVAMVAAGLHSPVFGSTAAKVCDTLEEALAEIKGVPAH